MTEDIATPARITEDHGRSLRAAKEQIPFEALQHGDYVKARVGNERLWFEVLSHTGEGTQNAIICRMVSISQEGVVFDGRCTLDRDWIIDTSRAKPKLTIVRG